MPLRSPRLRMSRRRFERVVAEAIAALPPEFRRRLQNVAVVVEDRPSVETLRQLGLPPGETLFGLYEGTPLGQRGTGYTLATPDRITIYREPLLTECATERELIDEIKATVLHEIAHHFGLRDDELDW
ncbi:MAG TPA: metallopeptidase family protein [Chloroflexota bacterium]